jgi:hypothetical protein
MNSRLIIIGNILPKNPAQVRLPEHDHVIVRQLLAAREDWRGVAARCEVVTMRKLPKLRLTIS